MTERRWTIHEDPSTADEAPLARALQRGLAAPPYAIPCRFFYDEEGSRLFEEITRQPEYYVTRAEDEILARRALDVVELVAPGATWIELGSGSATKTLRLLEAARERREPVRFAPIDVSASALEKSARALTAGRPWLELVGYAAEFRAGFERARADQPAPHALLWLGSTVGNLDRAAAAGFLAHLSARLDPPDRLLLGVDLRKPRAVLERAYDDAAGVTARFNKNLLARINAELGADFDLDRFRHVARYDEEAGRVELHLESLADQVVRIPGADLTLRLARGERIHTENSTKYSVEEIETLARAGGFARVATWTDGERRFASVLLAPVRP